MSGITIILSLLSGVALFLFGMSLMGDGLKRVAGNKLELVLYKLTNTPIKGLLLGTVVTAIIQSSSATTVMVVGFVNSGMMKVAQAIGIIMGANIGTSITGWILCLSYIDGSSGIAQLLSTATISAVVAIVGIVFKMFFKKSTYKNVGDIMLGFAILMVGMQTMSGAVSPLKENEHFVNMLTMFTNPFLGILVGFNQLLDHLVPLAIEPDVRLRQLAIPRRRFRRFGFQFVGGTDFIACFVDVSGDIVGNLLDQFHVAHLTPVSRQTRKHG